MSTEDHDDRTGLGVQEGTGNTAANQQQQQQDKPNTVTPSIYSLLLSTLHDTLYLSLGRLQERLSLQRDSYYSKTVTTARQSLQQDSHYSKTATTARQSLQQDSHYSKIDNTVTTSNTTVNSQLHQP
ncbi:hypothetical protein Pmani_022620 [Petrolisthes manimaculis]|uniref:Uncharacterized protein n=1 Tax=Petrolisthes manimaculis TaxID=1843537 RepID=A0AAE1PBE9_9EUCA|nr:hypothetical protein Pmani_022620 [Petrolisthes manimaculis]